MIQLDALTKRYGDRTVVDHLTFEVRPGEVTGFLGPNGAGKSTTMRSIVGLDRPSTGTARVAGRRYAAMPAPLGEVGTLLDARATNPRHRAVDHLRALAATHGLPRARVSAVLDQVGLTDAASRRTGVFSLGMRQRLGIAAALLGDPGTIILDEPVNGLDPEGIVWIRQLLASLADEGRTVFLSSHLMTEMALVADRVIVIGQGRLIADTTVPQLTNAAEITSFTMRSPDLGGLEAALSRAGLTHTRYDDHVEVAGSAAADQLGRLTLESGIVVTELTPHRVSLESAVLQLTDAHRDHAARPNQEVAA